MTNPPSPHPPAAPSDPDDYMTMPIADPTPTPQKETYTQRRVRLQRESEAKSRPKSKAELAVLASAARDSGLSTALPPSSKGFQMMAKLGFKPGSALGAEGNVGARVEPLGISVKEDRGGVGMENEKKRKFRDQAEKSEGGEKRARAEEGDYRERIAREREEKRVEGLWWGGMRVLEGLEVEVEEEEKKSAPTKKVNILYRPLVREREEKERERRMRYDLHQSLSKNAAHEDEDEQDRIALGREEVDVEEDDEELEELLKLEGKERLRRLVGYLREKHFYCFWCKYRYEDEEMEGCPGVEEDDHD